MSRIALVTDDLDIEQRVFQGLGPDRFVWLVTTHASLVASGP